MKKLITILVAAISVLTCVFAVGCENEKMPEAVNTADNTPAVVGGTSAVVNFKYYSDASNMLPALKQGVLKVGLVPEPAASKLEKVLASDKTWYRLDIQTLYDETASYPQAVLMIKQSVSATYGGIISALSTAITESVNWVKQNPAAAVNAVNNALAATEQGATPSLSASVITEEVVNNCKIYWQGAAEAKASVKKYVDDIISVGQTLDVPPAVKVEDDFFISGNETGAYSGDKITVCVPDGAPALAIAKLINDGNALGTDKTVEYKVVSADKIGSYITQGKAEIIVMPVNAASKTYKKYADDTYKMAAVLTHGNLYVMSTERLTINDLNGKTLGVIGQGNVPDLTLRAILKARNIEVKISD